MGGGRTRDEPFFGCDSESFSTTLSFPFTSLLKDAVTSGHDSSSVTGGTFLGNDPDCWTFVAVTKGVVDGVFVDDDDDTVEEKEEADEAMLDDVARAANCSLRTLQTLTMGALAVSIVLLVVDDGDEMGVDEQACP